MMLNRMEGANISESSNLTVSLYTRSGCSLCRKAKDVIMRVKQEIPFVYREIDISKDDELTRLYGEEIPVIFVCGRKAFKYRVDENRLRKSLQGHSSLKLDTKEQGAYYHETHGSRERHKDKT